MMLFATRRNFNPRIGQAIVRTTIPCHDSGVFLILYETQTFIITSKIKTINKNFTVQYQKRTNYTKKIRTNQQNHLKLNKRYPKISCVTVIRSPASPPRNLHPSLMNARFFFDFHLKQKGNIFGRRQVSAR